MLTQSDVTFFGPDENSWIDLDHEENNRNWAPQAKAKLEPKARDFKKQPRGQKIEWGRGKELRHF